MTGPERRGHEQADRAEPYGRPHPTHVPIPAPAAPPQLDAATQAAIQAAAAAAAAAAIAQQQRVISQQQAQLMPPVPLAAAPPSMPGSVQGFVKVSGTSDPRKVAGKLSHTCREGAAPAMLTIGSNCINQAVKAICIARGTSCSLLCMLLAVVSNYVCIVVCHSSQQVPSTDLAGMLPTRVVSTAALYSALTAAAQLHLRASPTGSRGSFGLAASTAAVCAPHLPTAAVAHLAQPDKAVG